MSTKREQLIDTAIAFGFAALGSLLVAFIIWIPSQRCRPRTTKLPSVGGRLSIIVQPLSIAGRTSDG